MTPRTLPGQLGQQPALMLVLLLVLAGCGKQAEGPPKGDDALLRSLVTEVADASRDAKAFRALFATGGTVPPDATRARYGKLYFEVVAGPSITGDTATARVRVRDDDSPQPLGQVDWTFAKEGGQWKLKTAPLP
jgi:hypothetical protein